MKKGNFTGRRMELEEEFFLKRDMELLQALREKTASKQRKQALAEASGIAHDDLLDQLIELDVSGETAAALSLVPLIAVAWADGTIDAKERTAVLDAAEELGDGAPYRFDLVNVARQVLSNHATKMHQDIIAAHQAKDVEALQEASDRLLQLIRDLDELVATREEFLLGPYLEDAKRWGTTDAERAKFQWNARRMVTAWGSIEKYNEWSYGLRDLCYKEWSGMLSGFYLKRWQWYLDELAAALKQGKTFDDTAVSRKTWEWELKWADNTDTYPTEPRGDSVEVARRLWKKYGNALGLDADNQGAGTWRPE